MLVPSESHPSMDALSDMEVSPRGSFDWFAAPTSTAQASEVSKITVDAHLLSARVGLLQRFRSAHSSAHHAKAC